MMDKTTEGTSGPTAEQLRNLPDDKLTEIAACANGQVMHCPDCGKLTAFAGMAGYNSTSQCHNCDYRTSV